MRIAPPHRTPDKVKKMLAKGKRLEWLTVAYLISAIMLTYLVLGSSQAMRAAWFEDILSLIPPIVFLVAARVHSRRPNERFPYGYHRIVSICYLAAGLALFMMGSYLLYDSLVSLLGAEHPTIGTVDLFGQVVWLGWLMLPALVWTGAPAVFLGRAKLPVAKQLHNKVLQADADMNKADWSTAAAAILGVIGVGFGFWWADSVAAGLISLDILRDGVQNTRAAISDLMDKRPTTVDHKQDDPLVDKLRQALKGFDWVEDADVRVREEGQLLVGEAFVVPKGETNLIANVREASRQLRALDWRIYDLVLTPVASLETQEGDA